MSYYQKYLKYKEKYLELKKKMVGGYVVGDFIMYKGYYALVIKKEGQNTTIKYCLHPFNVTCTENPPTGEACKEKTCVNAAIVTISNLEAETGERLMAEWTNQTTRRGSIFTMNSDPGQRVIVTDNNNMSVFFKNVNFTENEGKSNEKFVISADAPIFRLDRRAFLSRYTRMR